MNLEGKVALITGGARGLGKAFAEEVVLNGGQVAVLDVLVDIGLATATELNDKYGAGHAKFIRCDVSNRKQFENAFRETKELFGAIDIVVNNAGIVGKGFSDWEIITDINFKGVMCGSYLAGEYMRNDKGGRGGILINISSIAAFDVTAMKNDPIYATTKAGVKTLSRCLAPVLQPLGICVACLCPAFVDTQIFREGKARYLQEERLMEMIQQTGMTQMSDVVKAFRHVIDTDDITGQVISIIPEGMKVHGPRNLKGKM